MFPIDVVVTEVNDLDPKWFEEFNKYKSLELESGSNYVDKVDNQAFGPERFRNWNTLKYWFRGIDTCCPWVNKVFLIVASERQIPDWLDKNNPKLRIVYHNEYIPKELLPTFSARTIMTFIPCIKDLSEHFIYFDDDCFCLNLMSRDKFFNDVGKPKYKYEVLENINSYADILGNWGYSVENTYNLEKGYGLENIRFAIDHLFKPQLKSIGLEVLEENYQELYDRLKISRFRRKENIIPSFLFINVIKRLGLCEFDDSVQSDCQYVSILENTNFNDFKNYKVVCFNDIGGNYDFNKKKDELLKFFEKRLPNKSVFEK